MALQQVREFKGFDVAQAYVEIIFVGGYKDIPASNIRLRIWKDSTKMELLEEKLVVREYTQDNSVAEAYLHLKTLPEFADAVDV